jgi:ArsR family transcriptional regulator, arsenate/arsenite/antimonite-responsive transcriptional repressor
VKSRIDLWNSVRPGLLHPADALNLGIVFKALGDPTRIQMVSLLLQEQFMSVVDFQQDLQISQPLASHHLAKLVDAGVLQRSREGRQSFFWITKGALERLSAALVGQG